MAIGSIAAGYPSLRPNTATVDKPAASTAESGDGTTTAAFYPSPIFQVDPLAKVTVTEFRDPNTGAVTSQYPSAKVVEQYRRQREAGIAPTGETAKGTGGTGSQSGKGEAAGTGVPATSAAGKAPASTSTVATVALPAAVATPSVAPVASTPSASGRVSIHA
jgi:hypothetical protein